MDFVSHLKKVTSNKNQSSSKRVIEFIALLKKMALNKNAGVSIWGMASG